MNRSRHGDQRRSSAKLDLVQTIQSLGQIPAATRLRTKYEAGTLDALDLITLMATERRKHVIRTVNRIARKMGFADYAALQASTPQVVFPCKCPKCLTVVAHTPREVLDLFGLRHVGRAGSTVLIAQSYCRACRSGHAKEMRQQRAAKAKKKETRKMQKKQRARKGGAS